MTSITVAVIHPRFKLTREKVDSVQIWTEEEAENTRKWLKESVRLRSMSSTINALHLMPF